MKLCYVTLASRSLIENAEKYRHPEPGASATHGPSREAELNLAALQLLLGGHATKWDDFGSHLSILWPPGGSTPFSELAAFNGDATSIYQGVDLIHMVVLSGPDERDPVAKALDHPAFKAYAEAHLTKTGVLAEGSEFEVEPRRLNVAVSNNADTYAQLQSAVFDECAKLDTDARGYDFTVVNGIGGANVGVEALVWAAGVLKWRVAYGPAIVIDPPRPHLTPALVGDQWSTAAAIIERHRDLESSDARKKQQVAAAMKQAHAAGVLPYVAASRDGGQHHLAMSHMASRLVELGNETPLFRSATVTLLHNSCRKGAKELAARLKAMVKHWAEQDLFGGNLVHELVLHGSSHCEAVDRNVAALSAPLLEDGLLDPIDVFHLGIAAWLHDWGHSGMPLVKPDPAGLGQLFLPTDLRLAHGPISAYRIKTNTHTSNVDASDRARVCAICAHHQGWSSIGIRGSAKAPAFLALENSLYHDWTVSFASEDEPIRPKDSTYEFDTFISDADPDDSSLLDPSRALPFARLQLMVALFRVADASDIGTHRVPVQAERSREERWLDEARLGIVMHLRPHTQRDDYNKAVAELVWRAESQLGRSTGVPAYRLIRDAIEGKASVPHEYVAAWEYVGHCLEQKAYYEHHSRVGGTYLTVKRVDKGDYRVTASVFPRKSKDKGDVRFHVEKDIFRELGRIPTEVDAEMESMTPGQRRGFWKEDPGNPQKVLVGRILALRGITFTGAVHAT